MGLIEVPMFHSNMTFIIMYILKYSDQTSFRA